MSKSSRRPDRSGTTAAQALAWLKQRGTAANVAALQRYNITAPRAYGVTVGDIKQFGKQIGVDHALAGALWQSGWYEARILAAFVGDPAPLTVRQMNQWAGDFDSWAVVDTVCLHLFDRSPHAWKRIPVWAVRKPEFVKRAAFALIWSLSVHDKQADDRAFLDTMPLLEQGAADPRHFVMKAVDMALRAVGKRNPALHAQALRTAARLAQRDEASARWIGKHVTRELDSAVVRARLRRRAGQRPVRRA